MADNKLNPGTVRQTVEIFEARKKTESGVTAEVKQTEMPKVPRFAMDSEVNGTSLPSPTDTPYRTPSSSRSRQTSRQTSRTYEDHSPETTPPPNRLHSRRRTERKNSGRASDESLTALDESIPLSDPRRFTPTLHASLVSEILSLRRDAEIRIKDIERFEQNLHDAQARNAILETGLSTSKRENRHLKSQMTMLEGGTLSAITDLSKERDAAIQEAKDVRERLEQAQKKSKSNEDQIDRVQGYWQKDKETWNAERRGLETKIHITEGRLRSVLNEYANQQNQNPETVQDLMARPHNRSSLIDSPSKRSSVVTARRQSNASAASDHVGGRSSALSYNAIVTTSLADELALSGIDEDNVSHTDGELPASPRFSWDQKRMSDPRYVHRARRILGIPLDLHDSDLLSGNQPVDPRTTDDNHKSQHVDSAVQHSPPNSPDEKRQDRMVETPVPYNRLDNEFSSRATQRLSMISAASLSNSIETSDNAWEEALRTRPIMVSSSCQTTEYFPLPSTEHQNQYSLSTIAEATETKEVSTQTENKTTRPDQGTHDASSYVSDGKANTTSDLLIPTIAIIPPTSRPVSPEDRSVMLPPQTKNAGCQVEVDVLNQYTATGVQTEEIRVDQKSIAIPQPSIPPPPVPDRARSTTAASRSHSLSGRRNPNTANSSRRKTPTPTLPPINDDGPLSEDADQEISRPVRTSSILAGFNEEDEEAIDDDVFQDDEYSNRPTKKFTLSGGKMLQNETPLNVEEETKAIAAGRRIALENIRLSEDGLPPASRDLMLDHSTDAAPKTGTAASAPKRGGLVRGGGIRRTAMVQNGVFTHQTKRSLSSLGSTESSAKPPVAIPVRYSSARLGKSTSETGRNSRGSSNASPTRPSRRVSKPVRRSKSGPALSPAAQARLARPDSPPDTRVSIVPDMPNFRMPQPEQRPRAAMPAGYTTAHESAPRLINQPVLRTKTPSARATPDPAAMQQTSVVDAIAQTMVGEWMYKYMRRRKSFGMPERDFNVDDFASSANNGQRHKRWVWLAPYERAVMWSSRQPTDGLSLLGKGGRKLIIKSVLDIKDDNPMPRGANVENHFNRTIVILTPERALKFTATNQASHYTWLTALSFLSHSPVDVNGLATAPPMPPEEHTEMSMSPVASLGGSMRRRSIRDSIRIAKTSKKENPFRSFTTDGIKTTESDYERPVTQEQYDPVNDAALPPVIKRYHNRVRANTGPKPTSKSFRALFSHDNHTPRQQAMTFSDPPPVPNLSNVGIPPSAAPSIATTRRGSESSTLNQPLPPIPPMPPLPHSMLHRVNIPPRPLDTSNSSHSTTMRMDAFMPARQSSRIPSAASNRGPLRSLRLGRPSVRNLKEPNLSGGSATHSWKPSLDESVEFANDISLNGPSLIRRNMVSPAMTEPTFSTLTTPTEMKFSESLRPSSDTIGVSSSFMGRGF